MKALILGLALSTAFTAQAVAQELADGTSALPVTLRAAESYTVEGANGTSYDVRVAFPDGYNSSGDTRYPTLYVTDANFVFLTTVEAQRLLQIYGEVAPVLIVGVDRPAGTFGEMAAHRIRDLTTSPLPAVDSTLAAQYGTPVRSGGAEAFLTTLVETVVPSVEARYPTGEERGLLGYSVGGLLATHALFSATERFTHYLIASPSYWWGGGEMFERERTYAAVHDDLPAEIFISSGSQEPPVTQAVVEMDSTLSTRGYDRLVLTRHEFEGETHTSVPPAAISRGLRVLFGPDDE